ncbi:hypothetical protein Taro_048730 [Colocasia esculenta]|uniref:UBX domain-containing protein n=1 Tax=Colocasia esculenta TaxID=4460 RepID=A0A843X8Y3_COLES|nr:hypothetical protein [Colocasia esculenta]
MPSRAPRWCPVQLGSVGIQGGRGVCRKGTVGKRRDSGITAAINRSSARGKLQRPPPLLLTLGGAFGIGQVPATTVVLGPAARRPAPCAKVEASLQDKWLLVNLQSTDEFSSHMLNRDTWSNEAVAQTIRSNFIFWQVSILYLNIVVYHDTSEGKKVCTYYNLVNIPAVLVIDPITGQKMRAWNGMIQPDRLLEDLLPFMDRGPKEHHVVLPCKRPRESPETSKTISTDKTPKEDREEAAPAATAPLEESKDLAGSVATDEELKSDKEAGRTSSNETNERPIYPPLPEEPKGNRELLCRVGIRLPDGRRVQRSFLRTDPIQLLWSFCSSQLGEGETRPFRFTQAIPGASRSLEYGTQLTFAESGLSNSMISLAWE